MTERALVLLGIGVAIVATLWRFHSPGHRLLPLFFLLLTVASFSYYLGFVHRAWNPFRFLAQSAAITLFALAFLVAHVSRLDHRGIENIRRFIVPYPNIEEISFLPATAADQIQLWLVKSGDSAADVSGFYLRPETHPGWHIVSQPPTMVLERSGQRLSIFISDRPPHGSSVGYDLRSTQ
jgi:hypothetical protein